MGFIQKSESLGDIEKRNKQAKILQDFDFYGLVFYFQRCHINAWHDINDAMLAAKRIDLREYNLRKGAIDNLARQFFLEYASTLEANNTLYQLRMMTNHINEQIEKVEDNG